MRYQVPQFLDVEDKIFGPFTTKQFVYMIGGVGLGYLMWHWVPYLGWLLGLLMVALGAALAFYKMNNKPFVFVLESGFKFITNSRLYVWKRRTKNDLDFSKTDTSKAYTPIEVSTVGESKLSDLTWEVDTSKKNEIAPNNVLKK